MTPLILKSLHLLGAVLFIGNVIVTGLWSLKAVRTRDVRVIAFAAREVVWTDWWMTFGGGGLLTVSGFLLARAYGLDPWRTPWIVGALLLLVLSTALWLLVLVPCQSRMVRLSRQALEEGSLPEAFHRDFKLWSIVGWFATALLIGAMAVMVLKPH